LEISGLGPKRVKALHQDLHIDNLEDLKQAVAEHRVRELSGFGAKSEQALADQLAQWQGPAERLPLIEAEEIARPLVHSLRGLDGVDEVTIAGSFRRRKETVGDLDILVTAAEGTPVMERFTGYDEVSEVVSHGETRATVLLRAGLQVDLRLVPAAAYGAALHYFTGSKAHNIAVRRLGVQRDLKINEYGVFRGGERVGGRTEQEVYDAVDLPYIEPELREDRGEVEAAQEGRLPALITLDDIRGDLHAHTEASDGHDSLRQMAAAAAERGYAYLAITDHSQHVAVAHGLDPERMAAQIDAIDALNDTLDGRIRVLKSVELDILADGSLDLPDDVLGRLDLCVCAVHHKLDLPRVQHSAPMLSLESVRETEDVGAFLRRLAKALDTDAPKLALEPKLDGLSVELVYEDGVFTSGATRVSSLTGSAPTRCVGESWVRSAGKAVSRSCRRSNSRS
jgi:DNA polymerase (family 10)